jgi:hypothetical protein
LSASHAFLKRAKPLASSPADQYFQFNDETVRLANPKEILQDTTGSNANPYLLVYAKKNSGAIEVMTKERKKLLASTLSETAAEL